MTISDTPANEGMCRPELNEDKSTALNDHLQDIFPSVCDGRWWICTILYKQQCSCNLPTENTGTTTIFWIAPLLLDLRFIFNTFKHAPVLIMDNDFNSMF